MWPGFKGTQKTTVEIKGYVSNLRWDNGYAPAVIVEDVHNVHKHCYAFKQDALKDYLKYLNSQSEVELEILKHHCDLKRGFSVPDEDAAPNHNKPGRPVSSLDNELKLLNMVVWLSQLQGSRWRGTKKECILAYKNELARRRRNKSVADRIVYNEKCHDARLTGNDSRPINHDQNRGCPLGCACEHFDCAAFGTGKFNEFRAAADAMLQRFYAATNVSDDSLLVCVAVMQLHVDFCTLHLLFSGHVWDGLDRLRECGFAEQRHRGK